MKKIILFILIVLLSSFTYGSINVTDSLTNLYRMENLSYIDTISGVNGTQSGTVITNGKIDNGGLFDLENDYVDLGETLINPVDTSFTINFWMNFSALDNAMIYSNGDNVNGHYLMYSAGVLRLRFGDIPNYESALTNQIVGNWYMITVTYNHTTRRVNLFLNTTNIINTTESSRVAPNDNFRIGNWYNLGTLGFHGKIDEFMIYKDRVLNLSTINYIYNLTSAIRYPGGYNINYTATPNAAPVIQDLDIKPSIAFSNTDLKFYINSTDADNNTLIYYYNISNNNVSFDSGIIGVINTTYPSNNYSRTAGELFPLNPITNFFDNDSSTYFYMKDIIYFNHTINNTFNYFLNIKGRFLYDNTVGSLIPRFYGLYCYNSTDYINIDSSIDNTSYEIITYNIAVPSECKVGNNIEFKLNSQYNYYYIENLTFIAEGSEQGIYYNFLNLSSDNYNETDNISISVRSYDGLLFSSYSNDSIFISTPKIDNCTLYNNTALNFTLFNDNLDKLNGTLRGYFSIWVNDISTIKNYNISFANKSKHYFPICFDTNYNYSLNAQIIYYSDNGSFANETYFLNNATITNETQNIKLYLTKDPSYVVFRVSDYDDDPVANAYVSILYYDLATYTSRTTEIIKTDFNGQSIGHVKLNTQKYKFMINKDNELIFQSLDSGTYLTILLYQFKIGSTDFFRDYTKIRSVSSNVNYNNNTKEIEYTFNDDTGSVTKGCIQITKSTVNSDTDVYSSCVESSSGSLLYNLGNNTGDNTYNVIGEVYISSERYITEALNIHFDDRYKIYGLTGVFISIFLIITVFAATIFNPTIAVISSSIILILLFALQFIKLNISVLIIFIVLAALTVMRLRQSQ